MTKWPLINGSLGSEAWPEQQKQRLVAEPEAESLQQHPAPQSWPGAPHHHQPGLPSEKFFILKQKILILFLHL